MSSAPLAPPSASAKAKLKEIQKHVKSEEYEEAVKLSKQVIKEEKGQGAGCYNALVFAGAALSKLERYEEAEKALTQATILASYLPLAYQGLTKLYTEQEEWDKLATLLEGSVERAVESDKADDCAKALWRLFELRSAHGSSAQVIHILSLLSPSSSIYDLLLSLPQPAASSAGASETGSYVPFPVPGFPAAPPWTPAQSLASAGAASTSKAPALSPESVPSIQHLVHLPELSFALLIAITLNVEAAERTAEEAEVTKRRSRLGAGSEKEVRRAVARELLSQSEAVQYWEAVMAHPAAGDAERRAAEGKLFRHWYRLMASLSRNPGPAEDRSESEQTGLFAPRAVRAMPSKEEARVKVLELMQGMILLDVPDEAVWATKLEWEDAAELSQYEIPFLHRYIGHFPSSVNASTITGYLRFFSLPLPEAEDAEGSAVAAARGKKQNRRERRKAKAEEWARTHPAEEAMPEDAESEEEDADDDALLERAGTVGGTGKKALDDHRKDPFAVMLNGLEGNPKSIFAHRVVTAAYLQEQDWENLITISTKGMNLVKALEIENGLRMLRSRAAFDTALGTALVHYYPPKHHIKAAALLERVLESDPQSLPCLLGRGYIREEAADWVGARSDFEKVIALAREAGAAKLEAREQAAWCQVQEGDFADGATQLAEVAAELDAQKDKAFEAARVWWKLGQAEWSKGGNYRDLAHEHWVTALRRMPSYASAFTSIGIYYLEHADPPDFDRSQKCFQKAFELDATQGEAARRLVVGLAEEREWALVDVIVKRVIAGEGGLEGGMSGTGDSARFLPKNSWAWKAAGAVEMSYKRYAQAAAAFQVALRVDTEDVSLWIRLGEAYAKTGRQAASIKALQHALELDPDNWVANYQMGDIQRQLGLFADAIASYQRILARRPEEAGAAIALATSALDLGTSERAAGFSARARASLLLALRSLRLDLKQYRLVHWKIFADACLQLWHCCRLGDDVAEALESVLPLIDVLAAEDEDKRAVVSEVTSPALVAKSDPSRTTLMEAAICAYAYRADLLKYDKKVSEPPLYDLASTLHVFALDLSREEGQAAKRNACTSNAVRAIKKALDSDPSSPSLWNAFGTIASLGNAQLAQHAFIVSLELEPRNPEVWTNLGSLALSNEDIEVAAQCFSKAQIASPEHALSWLGQAIIAESNGDKGLAHNLFEQAATLSAGAELSANLGFANLTYERSLAGGPSTDLSSLHQSAFAVERYCKSNPTSATALTLFGLISERLGQHEVAVDALERASKLLDAQFEASEDEAVLAQYGRVMVNLGRARLALGTQDQAQLAEENFTLAASLDLPADLAVQCHLGHAIALNTLSRADESLDRFQAALDACDGLGPEQKATMQERVSVVLARTLWQDEGEEGKEAAKAHLLESLSSDVKHSVAALATLKAIGILSQDDGLLEAVESEIEQLNVQRLAEEDPQNSIGGVGSLAKLVKVDLEAAALASTASLHASPSSALARSTLAETLILLGRSAEAAAVSSVEVPSASSLAAVVAARHRNLTLADPERTQREAQKAIMLEPWNVENWQALASCSVE